MKTIIAIGGGEIGRPGYEIETEVIDRVIVTSAGKERPRLLFLPTATSDSDLYIQVVENYFGKRLGCVVDALRLVDREISRSEIEDKVFAADIVYVGGGNTMMMLEVWRKSGADEILKSAWEKGVIMSGLSAGAVCWFERFNSDSLKFVDGVKSENEYEMIELHGLGWVDLAFSPHYDTEIKRKPHFREMLKSHAGVGIGVDNCAALMIVDDGYRILRSRETAGAYKSYWRDRIFIEEQLPVLQSFRPLSDLTFI